MMSAFENLRVLTLVMGGAPVKGRRHHEAMAEVVVREPSPATGRRGGGRTPAYRSSTSASRPDDVLDRVWDWSHDDEHELERAGRASVDGPGRRLRPPPDATAARREGETGLFLDDLFTDAEVRGRGRRPRPDQPAQRDRARAAAHKVRWITAADNVTAQRLVRRRGRAAPTWLTYDLR